jgi:Uma2 family endonuclease
VASTTTKLMTFAEFERLPIPEGWRLELRHGELFKVPPPKYVHFMIQQILRDLLDQAGAGAGRAYTEVGFRPTTEHEYRVADVAYAANSRWIAASGQDYFLGAPDLVIEVLSPSNTATELNQREKLCLENGCREFWLVDPELRLVKVSTPDGHSMTYRAGQEIPLPLLNDGQLAVDAIFSSVQS